MMSPYSAEKAGTVLEGAGGTASTGSSRQQYEWKPQTAMGVMSRACPCSSDTCTDREAATRNAARAMQSGCNHELIQRLMHRLGAGGCGLCCQQCPRPPAA